MNEREQEKLASIRKRIKVIRDALEDPSLITELTIDGVAEKVNRAELRAELRELEAEEDAITGSGRARIYGVSFND